MEPSFLRLMAMPTVGNLSQVRTAALAVLIGLLSIVLHELSHCFVASRWGILTGTLRIQLYLGTIPIVGLKLAGLYTLPPRGRLAVWSAGVFTNLSITAAALLAIRTVAPGSAALGLTAAINWLLAIFNLMPLLPTDGYFMLCTLVKDSNVRVRAWSWVRRPFHHGQAASFGVRAGIYRRDSLAAAEYIAASRDAHRECRPWESALAIRVFPGAAGPVPGDALAHISTDGGYGVMRSVLILGRWFYPADISLLMWLAALTLLAFLLGRRTAQNRRINGSCALRNWGVGLPRNDRGRDGRLRVQLTSIRCRLRRLAGRVRL